MPTRPKVVIPLAVLMVAIVAAFIVRLSIPQRPNIDGPAVLASETAVFSLAVPQVQCLDGKNQVSLSWVGPDKVRSYTIQRRLRDSGGRWINVATNLPNTQTNFVDTTLGSTTGRITYLIKATGINRWYFSATYSNPQTITITKCTTQTPPPCTENWNCGDWSGCVNSSQSRTCTDSNACGTTANKPTTTQSCIVACTESWSCGNWSTCTNGNQTRTCTDTKNCGTTNQKPITSRTCTATCTENWTCGNWGSCTNGSQTRTCTDSNSCGTTTNKPATSQTCTVACTENWNCGVWSACTNGNQTRICTDANNCGTTTNKPATSQTCTVSTSSYPLHTNITATVFWVGEPQGGGSSEDNALSAWDDEWQKNYGGYDDPQNRNGYYPVGFTPKQNPFYLDLPYNDFNDNGTPKSNRTTVVPWANEKTSWGKLESMMKNRWVKVMRNGNTCYGQIEDAGPYQYDDYAYVFGTTDPRPKSKTANNAGMDVSPALRDCLQFVGWNNADNKVDWQFVTFADVPDGPWKEIITTSQINWP